MGIGSSSEQQGGCGYGQKKVDGQCVNDPDTKMEWEQQQGGRRRRRKKSRRKKSRNKRRRKKSRRNIISRTFWICINHDCILFTSSFIF